MADRAAAGVFVLSDSLSHQLHRALQLSELLFLREPPQADLTLRQFALLAAISEAEGRSQRKLVAATGIDRSTLADMIRRLQDRGLVHRVPSPDDRRANAVSLTDFGRAVLAGAAPAARAADEALADLLPKDDRKAFRRALKSLAKAAAAEIDAREAPRPEPAAVEATRPVGGKRAKAERPAKPAKAGKAAKTPKLVGEKGSKTKGAAGKKKSKSKAEGVGLGGVIGAAPIAGPGKPKRPRP